jgi:D-alanyl-D-alanine carboxypeptidase (penicillin-binding protein 5/6)
VKIEELLSAALINSANDAAVALAEAVAGSQERFVELMNRKAVAIGATNTHFVNASGLPGKNQYTTASDLAKIMRHALRYPKLKEIIGTRVTEISTEKGKTIFLRNTNRLLWSEEDLVGGKTGYTRKAKHCFVCAAEREEDTIIVALLGSPSRDSLWRESETLIAKGYDVIENRGKPEIYLATAVYDAPAAVKGVSKTTKNGKIKKSYAKTGKKKIAKHKGKKKRTMIAAKKKGKTKVALSKGKQRKYHTKKKAKKNYRIAIKGGVDKG